MNKKHTNNFLFHILLAILVVILIIVSFYMFNVHIPYYNQETKLATIRNEIVEKNNYQYDGYCYEYHGKNTYYILKIKVNDVMNYVAFDTKKKYVNSFTAVPANKKAVINAIKKRFNITLSNMDIGYENDMFVYYAKYQDDTHLYYFYYSLTDGSFIKYYRL